MNCIFKTDPKCLLNILQSCIIGLSSTGCIQNPNRRVSSGGENWFVFNPAKVLTAKHEGESSYRSRSVTQFYVRAASPARSLSAASAISNLGTRAKERKGVQEEEAEATSRGPGFVCKLMEVTQPGVGYCE